MSKNKPDPVDVYVGRRVRMRRMMLNMSQEKLADHFGLTFQQLQKYEKGTNRISSSRLVQIASALKVPVAFFFEGAPGTTDKAKPERDLIGEFFSSPYATELADNYVKIKLNSSRLVVADVAKALTL
jgi:transcriptional regulator with XRE-family HTH domain